MAHLFHGIYTQFLENSTFCDVQLHIIGEHQSSNLTLKCHSVVLMSLSNIFYKIFLSHNRDEDGTFHFSLFTKDPQVISIFLKSLYDNLGQISRSSSLKIPKCLFPNSEERQNTPKRKLSDLTLSLPTKKLKFSESTKGCLKSERLDGVLSYKCIYCFDIFSSKLKYYFHLRRHCKLSCPNCEAELLGKLSYVNHLDVHHNSKSKRAKIKECFICGVKRDSLAKLKTHVRRCHRIRFCKMCQKGFLGLSVYSSHVKEHQRSSKLLCTLCLKSFKSKASLKKHKSLFHKESKSQEDSETICETCSKVFRSSSEWLFHRKKYHEELEPVTCDKCGKTCKSPRFLKDHERSAHRERDPFKKPSNPVECEFCFKIYYNLDAKNLHHELLHGQSSSLSEYSCSDCDSSFSRREQLLQHRAQAHSKALDCELCETSHASRPWLDYHTYFDHHIGSHPLNTCELCNKAFISFRTLKSHLIAVHIGGSHVCHECGKQFLNKAALNDHDLSSHSKPMNHKCSFKGCTAAFNIHRNLRRHELKHEEEESHEGGERKNFFKCDVCHKSFVDNKGLNVHMKNKHAAKEAVTLQCDYCDKMFATLSRKRGHEKVIHLHRDRFSCGVTNCSFSSSTKGGVKNHQYYRHGIGSLSESNVKCDECDKTFRYPAKMREHYNYVHGNTTRFTCRFCDKSFRHQYRLDGHEMAVHIKEEPFKCPDCNKGFNRKASLWKHQKKVHGSVSQKEIERNKYVRFDSEGTLAPNDDQGTLIIENKIV